MVLLTSDRDFCAIAKLLVSKGYIVIAVVENGAQNWRPIVHEVIPFNTMRYVVNFNLHM